PFVVIQSPKPSNDTQGTAEGSASRRYRRLDQATHGPSQPHYEGGARSSRTRLPGGHCPARAEAGLRRSVGSWFYSITPHYSGPGAYVVRPPATERERSTDTGRT